MGYADLFKWFTNREGGIPAYALVNMTTQDAEIVVLGDSPIYYSESEPLVRNIDRHVQLELSVSTCSTRSRSRSTTTAIRGGYARCRRAPSACSAAPPSSAWSWWYATTGETQDLAIEDVPQWVDHAYPTDLLLEQYNWSGQSTRTAG